MLAPFLVFRLTLISKFLTLLRLTVNSIETVSSFYDTLPTGNQRKTISISQKSSTYYQGYFWSSMRKHFSWRWKDRVLKPRRGHVTPTREKNIYIEQCYICGITGYHNFLSLDRLSTFLGWQLPLGCYGKNATNQGDMLREDWNNREDSHQGLIDNVHSSGLSASKSRRQTNRDLSGNLSL